jgi:hypothetical protein
MFGAVLLACGATEPEHESESEPSSSDEIVTCVDPDIPQSKAPDFPLTYTTEHLDIFIDEERFMCAGSALEFERFVSYVSERLGIVIQRRIPFYFADFVDEWCPPTARACANYDGKVFAAPRSTYHELVHGVACEARADTPHILAEGLAVSFEPHDNSSRSDPLEFSEVEGKFSLYYSSAGHFVRWLYEQLGGVAFMDLYVHAEYESGVWVAIEDAYGTLAESDYLQQSPALWVPHRQCADLPLLEPTGDTWIFESRFDCDDPSTMGPYERQNNFLDDDNMYQSFLIEIEEPGVYVFERPDWTDGGTAVYLERCLDEHPASEQEIEDEWAEHSVWFNFQDVGLEKFEHAGLWRVDVVREHGPPVDVWVTIVPQIGLGIPGEFDTP